MPLLGKGAPATVAMLVCYMVEKKESPQLGKRGKKVVTAICKVIGSNSPPLIRTKM